MIFQTEAELASFAENLGKNLELPAVFELIGDVGAGKTTFTRALAKGLGIKSPVTSPSFTISKRYAFPRGELIHYDFYRLEDPGLMSFELEEALSDKNVVIVVEWGESIKNLLPASRKTLKISVLENGARKIEELS